MEWRAYAKLEPTLQGWIEALPQALIQQDVWLSLWYAWTLALSLDYAQAEPWIRRVEELTVANPEDTEASALLGQVEVIRATICANCADLAGTVQHAQAVLALLAPQHMVLRAALALNQGTAYYAEPAGTRGSGADCTRAYRCGDGHTARDCNWHGPLA